MKSFGVTAPPVSRLISAAVSRDIHTASLLQSAVMAAGDNPVRRANAIRERPSCCNQSASFMRRRYQLLAFSATVKCERAAQIQHY
ncbi:MAG: hypothetical protein O9972_20665 [Burkholderiales bacterium]|nr:hypothetical protein [Burkholderiales bacterium]